MKCVFVFVFLLSFYACSFQSTDQNDIVIVDSHENQYLLSSFGDSVKQEYGVPVAPDIVLVLAAQAENDSFKKQLDILQLIDAESHQFVYVVGCVTGDCSGGYKIDPPQVSQLLGDEDFRLKVHGATGKSKIDSSDVLSEGELIKLFGE